jgi:hypothetical protein
MGITGWGAEDPRSGPEDEGVTHGVLRPRAAGPSAPEEALQQTGGEEEGRIRHRRQDTLSYAHS